MTSNLDLMDDKWCFACGSENPIGLKLKFRMASDSEMVAEWLPEKSHQGFKGLLHGGLMALVLDEVMVNLAWKKGLNAVSVDLRIRYKKAVRIGEKVTLRSWIDLHNKRLVRIKSQAESLGSVVAEAEAQCLKMKKVN